MNKSDRARRRFEGYYQGGSGHRSQFEWEGPNDSPSLGGGYQTFGDDAKYKHSRGATHHNVDHFGWGNSDREWNKNIDNRKPRPSHFGKGPKGYNRSSERIYEDVCEALTEAPEVDASDISVNVEDGIVTLTGTVEGRRVKRMAEDVVDAVLGVDDVVNLLRMVGEGRPDQKEAEGSPLGKDQAQEPRRVS